MNRKNMLLFYVLSISVAFTVSLIIARAFVTQEFVFIFFIWNLFLAVVPFLCSYKLSQYSTWNIKTILWLFIWLLFFPNAPYLVTDIFHFKERIEMPKWYDLLIVVTAAWNGLILGFASLFNIEKYLIQFYSKKKVNFITYVSFALCGFGVYLGRFLRFNSWDVFNNIDELVIAISHRCIHPFQHTNTWGFSILFSIMLLLFYNSIKVIKRI